MQLDNHEHRHTLVEEGIKYIREEIKDIKENHIHTLNRKRNWLIVLFITFLITIIVVLIESTI